MIGDDLQMQVNARKSKYFNMIVQEKSISKAAQKLYISQPSLSKFLTQLEDEIGTKLFDRSSSPLMLTYAGEKYYEYLNQATKLYDQFMRDIRMINPMHSGELRIGYGPWRSAFIASKVLPQMRYEYPNLKIIMSEERNDHMKLLLSKNQIDLAVSIYSPTEPDFMAFNSEALMQERLLIIVSKDHPFSSLVDLKVNSITAPQKIDVRLLEKKRLITGKPGQKLHDNYIALVEKYNLSPVETIETMNINTAIELAANNFGIAFVPSSYLLESSSIEKLCFFYSEDPILTWIIKAEYSTEKPSEVARRFSEIVKEAYLKVLYPGN